jgi:hypothetical protein
MHQLGIRLIDSRMKLNCEQLSTVAVRNKTLTLMMTLKVGVILFYFSHNAMPI